MLGKINSLQYTLAEVILYRVNREFVNDLESTKVPSTKISYIPKSRLSRDANSKERTNF